MTPIGKTKKKLLPLFAQLGTFNFLDLLGAEDQHAVLEAAHLTRGGFPRRRGRGQRPLLVPCGVGRRTKKVSNQSVSKLEECGSLFPNSLRVRSTFKLFQR